MTSGKKRLKRQRRARDASKTGRADRSRSATDKAEERARGRVCGPCQVCCEEKSIPELRKPSKTSCEHQCGKGCGIYEDRPVSCFGYRCAWLKGFGGARSRPDLFGILIDEENRPDQRPAIEDAMGGAAPEMGILVWREVREGALETHEALTVLRAIRKEVPVCTISLDGVTGRLYGPKIEDEGRPVSLDLREWEGPEGA